MLHALTACIASCSDMVSSGFETSETTGVDFDAGLSAGTTLDCAF